MYVSISMKVQNRLNQFMVLEVRIVVALGGRVAERKEPWGGGGGVHSFI